MWDSDAGSVQGGLLTKPRQLVKLAGLVRCSAQWQAWWGDNISACDLTPALGHCACLQSALLVLVAVAARDRLLNAQLGPHAATAAVATITVRQCGK